MSLSMLEKKPVVATKAPWSAEVSAEFEREKKSPNGCVGKRLLSENERVRVWDIRLAPGERFGFHRHVLDYFWSCSTGGKARAHLDDGTIVEHTYTPGARATPRATSRCTISRTRGRTSCTSPRSSSSTAPISRCRCRIRCG